jgi:hypothetical protein
MNSTYPEVFSGCRIFQFPTFTSLPLLKPDGTHFTLHHTAINTRQRALIHLFGKRTLLNWQPGGIFAHTTPQALIQRFSGRLELGAFAPLRTRHHFDLRQNITRRASQIWSMSTALLLGQKEACC